MPLKDKFISEILPADINNLVKEGVAEDAFLEFREILADSSWSQKKTGDEKESVVGDLVAFANAAGGLLILGVETNKQERAVGLKTLTGDQAKKIADSVRDLAIQNIEPNIELQVSDFRMDDEGRDWIVIARVPESAVRPHRTKYHDRRPRFLIRDWNRKRDMTYGEIMRMFQATPQQQSMVRILGEIEYVRSEIEALRAIVERRGA